MVGETVAVDFRVPCKKCSGSPLPVFSHFQDINTEDIAATDAQSPCCEVPCAANETLCDLLLLEGLPDATRKSPRELVMNIRLVRSSSLRAVAPHETLGLAVTAFQMDNTSVSSCR